MEEMRKTVFITGTINETIIDEISKLLDYIGYEALFDNRKDIDEEVKRDRLNMLLNSDGILYYGNNGGRYQEVFQKELNVARYLNLVVISYERTPLDLSDLMETLESLVTKKVLMEKEDENKEEENNENNLEIPVGN